MRTPILYTALLLTAISQASYARVATPTNISNNNTSLQFIENKGQIINQSGKHRNDIDFKLETNDLTLFIGRGQVHYQWTKYDNDIQTYRLDMILVGANPNAQRIEEEITGYFENYYLPQCPNGVIAGSYNKVSYNNIYPNIDFVLSINSSNEFKYDFVVHQGGRPQDIKMRYEGASAVTIHDGKLVIKTPFGIINDNAPYTYSRITRKQIPSSFVLTGNVLSFNVNEQSILENLTNDDIIIDPIVRWGTYYGGSGNENFCGVIADTVDNAYLFGRTASTANIATSGAFKTTLPVSDTDGFVVKFNKSGQRLWATYYGGTGFDDLHGGGISNDTNMIYFVGYTKSTSGIATSGSHQPTYNGSISSHAFIVKLNGSGQRQWATYYSHGGLWPTHAAYRSYIACDAGGNIYLTTDSLVKFNATGIKQWATYFGDGGLGNVNFYTTGVTVDGTGNVLLCGLADLTSSGVATAGAFQTSPNSSGEDDAFIEKFNSSGAKLWGTYFGSIADDGFVSLTTDAHGNIYAGGYTASTSGITTVGSHQPSYGGGFQDGLLVKFNSSGQRQWSTYYGGSSASDWISSVVVTPSLDLYIAGGSYSSNNIATPGAYKTTVTGGNAFLAIFNTSGIRQYGTYYGGSGEDFVGSYGGLPYTNNYQCVAFGKIKLYLGNNTNSISGIATSSAFQVSYGGGTTSPGGNGYTNLNDGYLVQFDPDTSVFILKPFIDTFFCAGDTLKLKYGVTQPFRPSNVFTVQLSNSTGSFASPTVIGSVTNNIAGTLNCVIPQSTPNGTGYRVRILASGPVDTSLDNEVDIRIWNYPANFSVSSNSPVCSGNTLNLTGSSSTSGIAWSWNGPGGFNSSSQSPTISNAQTIHSGKYILTVNNAGCIRKDSTNVTVNQTPNTPTAGSNSPVCAGGILNLMATNSTTGTSYSWSGPAFSSTQQNPSITPVQMSHAGNYTVTAILGPCSSGTTNTSVTVNTGPQVSAYANPGDTICAGDSAKFVALPFNAGSSPTYQWYRNGNPVSGATTTPYPTNAITNGDVFFVRMTAGTACNTAIQSNSITMNVLPVVAGGTAKITVAPDSNVWPGVQLYFTATVVNCNNPQYQWKRNGNDIIGATANPLSVNHLSTGDVISCIVTCKCGDPKAVVSNGIKLKVDTKVGDPGSGSGMTSVVVYPNPTTGELVITSPYTPFAMHKAAAKGGTAELINLIGQTILKQDLPLTTNVLRLNIADVPAGTYMLQLQSADGYRMNVKVVKE
jgi:hypothetical protein